MKTANRRKIDMNTHMFERLGQKTVYRVPVKQEPISGLVNVPGSKSVTNRALLLACLADGTTTLSGVLFSDDSRHFIESLISLGFNVLVDEANKTVTVKGLNGKIPHTSAEINVGSAGTASRFLTAMLALSDGRYIIQCSEQMKKRPMKPLFDALTVMGAQIEYIEKEGFLPVVIEGNHGICKPVTMDISKSTQFLSALLMVSPMANTDMQIQITSDKKDGAYIDITRSMMEAFHVPTQFDGSIYSVAGNSHYQARNYQVEPDVSAACYFYAIAALTGGCVTVSGIHPHLMQGDMAFLQILKQLGCTIDALPQGIQVTGPNKGVYPGIEANLNNFSDQTMTLAVLAAFATSPTVIKNIAHIRVQECDRMQAIVNELSRIGIECTHDGNNIYITPKSAHGGVLETYDDHRMAMALSLIGLKVHDIIIDNPGCCKKTFENYFEVFENLLNQSDR